MARPSVRGKLVHSAMETFQARGFNGCSVQDIVDAADVPKGSFYNHFKTKESLALEVLARYMDSAHSEFLLEKKLPPLKRLRAYFEMLAKWQEQSGCANGCLIGTFASELSEENPRLRAAVDDGFKSWSRAVAVVLREAQADGSLSKKHDADRLGRYLINSWEGATQRAKVTRNRKPLDEFFAVTFETLLN